MRKKLYDRASRPQKKRSPEIIKRILEVASSGLPLTFACAAAGISVPTLSDWRARDPEFDRQLDLARYKAVEERWQRIAAAAKREVNPDWKADAWSLERTYPQFFGRPDIQVALTGGPVTNNTLVISVEAAQELAKRGKPVNDAIEKLVREKTTANGDSLPDHRRTHKRNWQAEKALENAE